MTKFDAARWDKQIELDSRSGKLDKLAEAAKAEHRTLELDFRRDDE